jgi:hypothetical protein
MATPTATLTGDQLEAFTGLTDRRHRQLAKLGYFPPPERGLYQQVATIRGLFKYYREDRNIAATTLNQAKLEKLSAEAEMAKIKLGQARGDTIDREAVADFLQSWTAKLDMLLTSELETGLPNRLVGQPIEVLRYELRECHDRIRAATARGLLTWEDDNPKIDPLAAARINPPPEDQPDDE